MGEASDMTLRIYLTCEGNIMFKFCDGLFRPRVLVSEVVFLKAIFMCHVCMYSDLF